MQHVETNRVRALRRAMGREGWSQEYLARRAGVSVITISRLERGEGQPTPRVMNRVAKALAQPVELVFPEPQEVAS